VLQREARDRKVGVVDRIEGAAEDADPLSH
jgi:hypothetical protein